MRHPALAGLLALAAAGCSASQVPAAPPGAVPSTARHAVTSGRTERVYGHSVRGRALQVWQLGSSDAARRVLVIGVIHGDEPAGYTVAGQLLQHRAPEGATLMVVPDANPDATRAGTRQNADGVDLNRNFPHDWRPLGRPGDQQYSGPAPLSEPESRALVDLIRAFQPTVTVWFHQPEGVVDESGGAVGVERRFAGRLGEPLRRLVRYPGSGVGWENHVLPGTTAFVVELPRRPSLLLEQRAVAAVLSELSP